MQSVPILGKKDNPLAKISGANDGYTRRIAIDEMKERVFQRLIQDWCPSFGDGGEAALYYPVLACPKLPGYTPEDLKAIAAEMQRLADERKDVQQNGIVEDIVDPELFPRLVPQAERKRAEPLRLTGIVPTQLVNSPNRGSYTWLPSRVVLGDDGLYRFASPINNLPRTKNAKLYEYLERLMNSVMPALIDRGAEKCGDGSYNVVVKLQRYRVPPGMAYTGQWHTEGVTEGVSAAGVVYVDWPAELSGGSLKFRLPSLPAQHYRKRIDDISLALSIAGQAGSSVVFTNDIPHRFETLRNESQEVLTRSFVNFFVTDPTLPTTGDVPTNADIYLALSGALNYDVVGEVLGWLQLTPIDRAAAHSLRSIAKAEMVANRGRWGVIHYGNCGQTEYVAGAGPSAERIKKLEGGSDDDDYWDEESEYEGDDSTSNGTFTKDVCWSEVRIASHDDTNSDAKSIAEV